METVVKRVHQATMASTVQAGNVASKWTFWLHKYILHMYCVSYVIANIFDVFFDIFDEFRRV